MQLVRSKIGLAEAVLGEIMYRLPEDGEQLFWLEMYANCREQGYHIRGSHQKSSAQFACSFSESRNCDDIVVYCKVSPTISESIGFTTGGNIPTDDTYQQARRFRYASDAATYIVERMSVFAKDEIVIGGALLPK